MTLWSFSRLRHFRYLLVDEYQDTNETQYQILQLLAGADGRMTVVGDDDQSIYGWRGAQPENLQQLAQDYPRLEVIKLEQNYRCHIAPTQHTSLEQWVPDDEKAPKS